MKPIKPMKPMEWLPGIERWWPKELGEASSAGSQNGVRYAFFPNRRRLLIQENGATTTYDSGDHQIGGVSQQNNGGVASLAFTSQHGPVALNKLTRVD